MFCKRLSPLVALAAVLAAPLVASAQDYAVSPVSDAYVGVGATEGTTLFTDSDDGFKAIDLPFVFRIYGKAYGPGQAGTKLWVSVNGGVSFAAQDSVTGQVFPLPGVNAAIPSTQQPQAVLAALWDDFVASPNAPDGGSRIAWKVEGTAPDRVLVVDWRRVQLYANSGSTGATFSFSLRLHESTDQYEVRYGPRGGDLSKAPLTATSGLENAQGSTGTLHFTGCTSGCTGTDIAANTAILVSPNLNPELALTLALDGTTGQGPAVVATITNAGKNGATVPYKLYLSTDATLDASDTLVYTSPALDVGPRPAVVTDRAVLQLAPDVLGTRYVVGIVDPDATIPEINKRNNVGASAAFVAGPELSMTLGGPGNAIVGGRTSFTVNLANTGVSDAANVAFVVRLSGGDLTTPRELYRGHLDVLPGLGSNSLSVDVDVPSDVFPGSYVVTAAVDPDGAVTEVDETNDGAGPLALELKGPDVAVGQIAVGARVAYQGQSLPVRVALQNLGPAKATDFTYSVFLSTNDVITLRDVKVYTSPPLTLDGLSSREDARAVPLPENLALGPYYVGVIVDAAGTILENDRGNNVRRADDTVTIAAPLPDVTVSSVGVTPVVPAGELARVSALVTNVGAAPADFEYSIVLSGDANVSPRDTQLARGHLTLGVGQQQMLALDARVPSTTLAGVYTLGVLVDPDGAVAENDETNNGSTAAIEISAAPLAVTTPALPDGLVGIPYDVHLAARGGDGRFTWRLAAGALPNGITLDPTGRLSGAPLAQGQSSVVFEAKSGDLTAVAAFALNVRAYAASLGLLDDHLPAARRGVFYQQNMVAVGGNPPYRFRVQSGELPAGLQLAEDGTVSGLPTTVGTNVPVIAVEDNGGHRAAGSVQLNVLSEAALGISETRLADPEAGRTYVQALHIAGGTAPFTVAITDGTLPPGLALAMDDAGQSASITGTATAAGVWPVTVSVGDSRGELSLSHYVLRVTRRTLSFVTVSLPSVEPGEDYREAIDTNAKPPATFSLAGGELPPGLRLDGSGTIGGTVASDAPRRLYAFSVRVEDANGGVGVGPFAIDVPAPAPVAATTSSGCATGEGGLLAFVLVAFALLGRRRRALAFVGAAAAALVAFPAQALYRVSRESGTFTNLSGGSVIYDSTTDATAKATALPLPFTFNFYGTVQTSVAVSTTGLMSFGSVNASAANSKIPTGGSPILFIAPWWDDLKLSATTVAGASLMSWKVEGTAPNRAFVVEWRNMQRNSSTQSGAGSSAYSFQVRLYEGSNDVTLHYGGSGATTGGAPTLTASMGIQGPTGAQGIELSDTRCSPGCAASAFPVNAILRLKLSPDLVVDGIQAPPAMFADLDTPVSVHLKNVGGALATGAKVTFKLSRDLLDDGCVGDPAHPELDDGRLCEDAVIGTSTGSNVYPNADVLVTTRLRASSSQNLPAGVYNLLAIADEANAIDEVNESNNAGASTAIALSPPAPDFTPTRLQGAFAADAGRPYQLTRTIKNIGNKEGSGTFTVVLSSNSVTTLADTVLEGPTAFTLAPGAVLDATVNLTIPGGIAPGKYWIGLLVRPSAGVDELDALNDDRTLGPVTVRGGALTITVDQLPDVTAGVPFAIQLTSSGGTGDVQWASGFPAPPAGVTVTPSGVVSGVLDVAGEWPLQVQLTSGGVVVSRTFGLRAVGHPVPLALASTRLPNANVGAPYEARLAAIGGHPPYTWSLVAPSALPDGLVLSTDGVVEGVPNDDGAATFTVKVTDMDGTNVSGQVELAIPGPTRPLFVTRELPDGVAGQAYAATVAAAGGTQPYRYAVVDSRRIPDSGPIETNAGAMPTGLTLAEDGTISGTPAVSGLYVVTLTVKDAHGFSDTAAYALSIGSGAATALAVRTGTLPDATVGTPYSAQLVAEGGTGKLTWHVELLEGVTFPSGIEFTDSGRLVGTPGVTGSIGFLAVVRDESGRTASRPLGLRVGEAPPAPVTDSGCAEAGPGTIGAALVAMFLLARRRRAGALLLAFVAAGLTACTAAAPPPCGGACASGLTCDTTDNLCKCGGQGGAVCATGETCDAASKTCLAPTCATTCPAGTSCGEDGACHCGSASGAVCLDGETCSGLGRCERREVCAGVVCSAGMTCDPSQQGQCRCGPGGPACKSGERCVDGACKADKCLGVACTGGTLCDPADGACKCGGAGGALCLNGEACDPVVGRCQRSSRCAGVTCPAGEACDPADGSCRCGGAGGPVCNADQSCDPVATACIGGDLCANVVCEGGQSCDSETGTCKCGGFGGIACASGDTCLSDATSHRCVTPCDPLASVATCGEGRACRYDGASATSWCVAAGTGVEGDACDLQSPCDAGLHCVIASGQTRGTCRTYCADSTDCSGTAACNPFVTGGLIGACVPR